MNTRILDLLHCSKSPTIFTLVTALIKIGAGIYIQKKINLLAGKNLLVEDGIVGYNTVKALLNFDEDIITEALVKIKARLNAEEPKGISGKDAIMTYLGTYEGTIIHWNKGETAITTPYGVYAKPFPNSKPVKFANELAVKYTGRKFTYRDLKQIATVNNSVTPKEKMHMKNLCWNFYVNNFMNKNVIPLLTRKPNLSYFSCSVNAGRSRGAKVLQKAVNAKPDGKIGKITLSMITKAVDKRVDINKGILDAMRKFYLTLIRINPSKFGRFKNGWLNRLISLR